MNYLETQVRPSAVRRIEAINARQGIVNLAVDFGFEPGHPAHVYVA